MSKAFSFFLFSLLLFHLCTLRKIVQQTNVKYAFFNIFSSFKFSQKQSTLPIYLNKTLFSDGQTPQVKLDFKNNKNVNYDKNTMK